MQMQPARFLTVTLTMLTLTACARGSSTAQSAIALSAIHGAEWAHELLETGTVPIAQPRPSAMLGPYIAAFLSLPHFELSHSAISGVLSGGAILFQDHGSIRDESYALLEELGLILQVDIPDRLNRALDRQISLNTYRDGLMETAVRSQAHVTTLDDREEEAGMLVRELRTRASTIQRTLSDALKVKDYATASSRQAELSLVQGELAVATAKQREIGNIIDLFDDSLTTAAERLQAIDANREALVAGVAVTDTAGAEDLGVLLSTPRRGRQSDPKDVFGPVQPTP